MASDADDDLAPAIPGLDRLAHVHPPTHFVPAALLTLFCFLPLGVVALYYSFQVNPKWFAGDAAGARRASELAKLWCWLAFGVGVLVDFALVAFVIPGQLPQSGR